MLVKVMTRLLKIVHQQCHAGEAFAKLVQVISQRVGTFILQRGCRQFKRLTAPVQAERNDLRTHALRRGREWLRGLQTVDLSETPVCFFKVLYCQGNAMNFDSSQGVRW